MDRFACRYRCWVVAALTVALPSICHAHHWFGPNLSEPGFWSGTVLQVDVRDPSENRTLGLNTTMLRTHRLASEQRSAMEFFVRARVQILALEIASRRLSYSEISRDQRTEFSEATLGDQFTDLGSMTSVLSLLSLMESIPVESSTAWATWQQDGVHRPEMLPHQVISDVSRTMWRRLSVGLAISSGLLIGTGGLLIRSNSARFPHFRGYFRPQWSKRKIGLLFSGRF